MSRNPCDALKKKNVLCHFRHPSGDAWIKDIQKKKDCPNFQRDDCPGRIETIGALRSMSRSMSPGMADAFVPVAEAVGVFGRKKRRKK